MLIKIARLGALCSLLACGDSTPPTPITPDAPPDAPEDPPDNLVFVELFGSSPVFVRYRTGDGEWQEPIDTGDGYELLVGDDYELVAVCANQLGSGVEFVASTFAEGASTFIQCFPPSSGSSRVEVTGTMTTPGAVYMNSSATGDTPNWSFDFEVPLGTHDLIAIDAERAIVRRDVEVLGTTALPAIDTTDGALLLDRSVTTNATASEDVTTGLLWFTGNSAAFIPLGGTDFRLPPASLVEFTDFRYVSVDAASGTAYRSVYLTDAGATQPVIDVEFLPQLEDVAFNADGVTWSGTLPGDQADLYLYEGINSITINASAGWLASRNKLSVDTDIPGFDPAWRISDPDYRGFSVGDSTAQAFRSSAVYDFGSATAPDRARERTSHRRRAAMLR